MPSAKPGIVLDIGRQHQLTAGVEALQHERREVGARRVEGGRVAGRPRSHDQHVPRSSMAAPNPPIAFQRAAIPCEAGARPSDAALGRAERTAQSSEDTTQTVIRSAVLAGAGPGGEDAEVRGGSLEPCLDQLDGSAPHRRDAGTPARGRRGHRARRRRPERRWGSRSLVVPRSSATGGGAAKARVALGQRFDVGRVVVHPLPLHPAGRGEARVLRPDGALGGGHR